jgi:hypothetical protein
METLTNNLTIIGLWLVMIGGVFAVAGHYADKRAVALPVESAEQTSEVRAVPAKKTATKKPAVKKGGSLPRWTEDQIQLLREEVAKGPTAQAAFERVAKKLGKSKGTVQQKYYAMKKASGTPTARQARAAKVPAGGYSRGQLARLEPADLVKLIETAKQVLEAKEADLAKAEEAELAAVKARFAAERKAIARAKKA